MKTKINFSKRDYKIIGITLFAGLFFGWLFFHNSKNEGVATRASEEKIYLKNTIWTCSMHPQIRMDHPGKCPICGMDLIPLNTLTASETAVPSDEIQMTEDAMKIADIQTMAVRKAYPDKSVYLLGKVKPDERNIAELTARFGGRIEKLFVNFTGQNVQKGEKLTTIYSPAMVTAQKELLEAAEYKQSNPELYNAARNKLKLWDLTDAQIDAIEQNGQSQSYFDVLSPIKGTVTRRNVTLGDYVKEGSALFQVIDLTRIWVMFEAYESDLPWVKLGDKVNFTVQSLPGKNYNGQISFIDPLIDPATRIARVRVEIQNPGLTLKPEMFVNGVVTSSTAGNKKDLLIPKTAVLWTGKRAVVYVKVPDKEQPTFRYREITLGPAAGDFYVVDRGLREGEEIAVNGVFKIDAAAQLAGKPSMMNPEGGSRSMENMPGMDMTAEGTENISSLAHQGVYLKNSKSEPDPQFQQQLTNVYKTYLPMQHAFFNSDSVEISVQARHVSDALKKVDMEPLEGKMHMLWMDQLDKLNDSIDKIISAKNLAAQREAFAGLNLAFYESIKSFGLQGITTYYQYCPMAINQKGAYWFSEKKEIENPYFGVKMPKCGETSETLNY
jgi:Cu(I)/Ag(I) efflux system membrane fusion protein